MSTVRAFGGLAFSERMFMARLEMGHPPRLRVYEVDPQAIHVPDYLPSDSFHKCRVTVVPRQQRAWHGDASRKLCPPGFAAFGADRDQALTRLLSVMRSHRDSGGESRGLGEAIRLVRSTMEVANASRAAV